VDVGHVGHLIEIPPSSRVIVTCTTGFSWGRLESPSILTEKNFGPAIGGKGLGPLGPLVYASGDGGSFGSKEPHCARLSLPYNNLSAVVN